MQRSRKEQYFSSFYIQEREDNALQLRWWLDLSSIFLEELRLASRHKERRDFLGFLFSHMSASSSWMVWILYLSQGSWPLVFSFRWSNHGAKTRLNYWLDLRVLQTDFSGATTATSRLYHHGKIWERKILQEIWYSSNIPWRQPLTSASSTTRSQ